MALYLILLLVGAAPANEPVIARGIHSKPAPLWESSRGLVDDRPALGYALNRPDDVPGLDYDVAGLETWEQPNDDRHETAFEEAIDMAKDAADDIEVEIGFDDPE